jgi:hypothetical protein
MRVVDDGDDEDPGDDAERRSGDDERGQELPRPPRRDQRVHGGETRRPEGIGDRKYDNLDAHRANRVSVATMTSRALVPGRLRGPEDDVLDGLVET